MLLARRGFTFFLVLCSAFGLSVCGIDDLTGFLQNKVDGPRMDQDEKDLQAVEAEMDTERTGLVPSASVASEEAVIREAITEKPTEHSDEEMQGAVDAEVEAMQAEEAEEDSDNDGEQSEEDGEGTGDSGELAEENDVTEEATLVGDENEARQALKERMAERARLAQANHYSFTVGSEVYVGGKKCTVSWDGRPDHDFVKVVWLEGRDSGKTSGVIAVEDVNLQAVKVVEIGTGRHVKKTITSVEQKEQQKKRKKVKDTSRRRRSPLQKAMYGVKKLPMVLSLPYRGLKHAEQEFKSEMTLHTGLDFNGTLVDLLDSATRPKDEDLPDPGDEDDDVAVKTVSRRKNITEMVRNRTVSAAMKYSKEQISPLISAFTSEMRLPNSPLANLVVQTNLTPTSKKNHA